MCHKQGRHSRLVHADADAITSHTRLYHFKYGITNAVSIADADLVISKSLNREVLSELTKAEVTTPQKLLPVAVGIDLVDKYRTLLPSVTGEIS